MRELIEASEFGDWLLGEIADTGPRPGLAEYAQARLASTRLDALNTTKEVLLEFLMIQQAMLDAAAELRNSL